MMGRACSNSPSDAQCTHMTGLVFPAKAMEILLSKSFLPEANLLAFGLKSPATLEIIPKRTMKES
jgi:hypothetical protein